MLIVKGLIDESIVASIRVPSSPHRLGLDALSPRVVSIGVLQVMRRMPTRSLGPSCVGEAHPAAVRTSTIIVQRDDPAMTPDRTKGSAENCNGARVGPHTHMTALWLHLGRTV